MAVPDTDSWRSWSAFFLSRTASTLASIGALKGDLEAGLVALLRSKRSWGGLSSDDDDKDDALAGGAPEAANAAALVDLVAGRPVRTEGVPEPVRRDRLKVNFGSVSDF